MPTIVRRTRRSFRNADGAAAVEFALIAMPFLMMCLGILEFLFLHYNQDTLSDALFTIASQPSTVTGGDTKANYKTTVCNKNAFQANCTAKIKIERYKLSTLPTAPTSVAGTVWQGVSGDIVVLRVSLDTLGIAAMFPALAARESVIYKLP